MRAESVLAQPLTTRVQEAMSSPPQVARADDSVAVVARRMAQDKIGCMPILDLGHLVGIVTTTDILSAEAELERTVPTSVMELAWTAADVMSRDVVTIAADDWLAHAVGKMREARVRHLPVVDREQRLIGIISDSDLVLPLEVLRHRGSHRAYLESTRVG